MKAEEAIRELNSFARGDDQEARHGEAEDILLAFLSDNGFIEVAKAFAEARERVGFWYA